jgi:hypothetical protein
MLCVKLPADQLPPDVIQALAQGRKIDAIKRLRALKGLGLAEAKALVDAHLRSRQPATSFREAHAKHPSDDTGAHVFAPPDAGEDQAPRLQPPPAPNRSGLAPGEVSHSNAAFWVVAMLVAVLMAYYALSRS